MKVAVTGASGYLGKYLVKHFLSKKYRVVALINSRTLDISHPKLKKAKGDIRDQEFLKKSLSGCDYVIHSAVLKTGPEASSVNVEGAISLIKICKKLNVKRVINISTQSAKIKDKGYYAQTKYDSDKLFQRSTLDFTTLRVSLILDDSLNCLFGQILQFFKRSKVLPIFGSGKWVSNPILVDDVVNIIEACLDNKKTFKKTFDVGGIEPISFEQLLIKVITAYSLKRQLVKIPYVLSLLLAKVFELTMSRPPIIKDNVLGSNQDTKCNPNEILEILNYQPLSLNRSLKKVLRLKEKLRVGVVGLGKMGLLHTALLYNFPNVEIVSVSDQVKSVKNILKSLNLKFNFYRDYKRMIDLEVLDVVFVCTPTFLHLPVTEELIKNRINIFSEKPLTESLSKTQKLVNLKKDLITGVGYFYIFRKDLILVADLIKTKKLGEGLSMSINLFHSEVLKEKGGWLFNKKLSGGGVVINPTAHILAWLIFNFGTPQVRKVKLDRAYSKLVEDEAEITLSFKDLKVKIVSSWSKENYPFINLNLHLQGSNGGVVLDNEKVELTLNQKSGKYKKGLTAIPQSDLRAKESLNLNPEGFADAYFYQDQSFLKSLELGKQFEVNFEKSLDIERVIDQIYAKAN